MSATTLKPEVTIFTIATGKYWGYFLDMLPQFQLQYDLGADFELIVLTDQIVSKDYLLNFDFPCQVFDSKFPSWPLVTLMRYSEILRHQDKISSDTIMWVDADMRIVKKINFKLFKRQIRFARHPGFIFHLGTFLKLPIGIKRDILLAALRRVAGGQIFAGTWESNEKSGAFTRPSSRRRYVHGAIWGGPKKDILNMCTLLSEKIDQQLPNFPIWHDESYLNWYSSEMRISFLPKYFSGAERQIFSKPSRATFLSEDKVLLDRKKHSE
jgi:hypothetical protein